MSRGLDRWLIARLAPPDLREHLLDDLDEAFAKDAAHRGRAFKGFWRTRQAASALFQLLRLRLDRRRGLASVSRSIGQQRSSGLGRDLRYTLRLLRRAPGFTAAVTATLALGIGANAAIFSVIKAVLIEPLPYRAPDRLVMIWNAADTQRPTWLSAPEVASYEREATLIEGIGAYTSADLNFTGNGEPERVRGGVVTPGLFGVVDVPAVEGRPLDASDAVPGAPAVIVLGYDLWQRRFGGAPIVGQDIQVNGRTRTVVGIMPASFRLPLDYRLPQPTEAWVPLVFSGRQLNAWGDHSYFGVARLRRDATLETATAELAKIGDGWVRDGFQTDRGDDRWHRAAIPLQTMVAGKIRGPLLLLFGAVGLVLLIACANVANLLLARSDARRREMVVRAAIGASRGVLVRQVLTECLVLSGLGAGIGLGVAKGALMLVVWLRPAALPRMGDVTIDAGVLAFSGALAVVAATAFGAGPAMRFARANLAGVLRDSGRTTTPGRSRLTAGRALVVGQLACSVVLAIVAMLLVRSLMALYRVDLGFNPRNVLTAQLQLPPATYSTPDAIVRFYETALDRIRALPGVANAGAIRILPLSRTIGNWSITIEGRPRGPQDNPNGDFQWATPGYFTTMGLHLVSGRFPTQADRQDTLPVVVISEAMAAHYWPGEDVLGRRFKLGTADQAWLTIIGVVRASRHNAVVEAPRDEMYLLHSQLPRTIGSEEEAMTLVVRTTGDPVVAAGPVRGVIRALDPNLPLAQVRTLERVTADALSAPRFAAALLGVFAAMALLLAAIGTYGTMSLLVASRTPEIGVRLALGAGRPSVFGLIVGQGLGLAGLGIGLGVIGAVFAGRLIGTYLYGIQALDPIAFTAAPLGLVAVALIACVLPARRAASVDPILTLRAQ